MIYYTYFCLLSTYIKKEFADAASEIKGRVRGGGGRFWVLGDEGYRVRNRSMWRVAGLF